MTSKKSEKTVIKVIALVSKPSELKGVFDQLKNRNILVFAAPSVEAATKVLGSGVVDFCLMSVDHPNVDIHAWPQEIENKFQIPVITISELRDKQSMWRLTKVRVKNILYSKATAPSILARIELMKKIALANRASKMPDVQKSIMVDERHREGGSRASRRLQRLKDRFAEERQQKKPAAKLLAPKPIGTVTLTEAKYTFLRHSEEETPKEIVKRHKEFMELFGASISETESRFESDAIVLNGEVDVEDIPSNSGFSLFDEESEQNYPRRDDELLETAKFSLEDNSTVENFSAEGIAAEDTQKVILHCLRSVLTEFCNPNEFTKEANEFSNSMVISIKSKTLVGTFVIAEQFSKSNLNDLQTELYKYLRNFGFDWSQEEIAVQILSDLKVPSEIINSGVYVSGVADEGEMALSYYQEAIELPELTMPEDMKYFIDPKCLVKDTQVNFDIYLHLRVNSKDIQYLKNGSDLTAKQISKLKSGGAAPWVPRQQLSNLTEYILLQRLMRMIKGDDHKEMDEIEALLKIS